MKSLSSTLLRDWMLPQLRTAAGGGGAIIIAWRSRDDKRRVGLGSAVTPCLTPKATTTLTTRASIAISSHRHHQSKLQLNCSKSTTTTSDSNFNFSRTTPTKLTDTIVVSSSSSLLHLFRRHYFSLSPNLLLSSSSSFSNSSTTTPPKFPILLLPRPPPLPPRPPTRESSMEQNRKRTARARISAILFDLDNTLIETRKADTITCQKIAELMTREMDVPAGPAKKITDTFLRRFRRCPENTRVPLDEWRVSLWAEALGDDYEELAEDIYPRWKKLRYRNLVLSEANVNMLRHLHKEYQLALVTNGPSNSQWEKIRELKLQNYFDAIVVSGDLKWEKPQPEIFLRACQMLGVEAFECLMVGDKLETDIAGGFQAQLGITVWVQNSPEDGVPSHPPKPPPDFTIPDVSELVQILQGGKDKNKAGKNVRAKKNSTAGVAGESSSGGSEVASTSTSSTASSANNKSAGAGTSQQAEED